MNKVYELTLPLNSATFPVYGKGGNEVVYRFINGNITHNIPAYFMTSDPYFQKTLEESDIFLQGKVKFDKQTAQAVAAEKEAKVREAALEAEKAAEKKAAEEETDANGMKMEANIRSVIQAINYVQENFGVVTHSAVQAKQEAEKNGVLFPNLKVSTKNKG